MNHQEPKIFLHLSMRNICQGKMTRNVGEKFNFRMCIAIIFVKSRNLFPIYRLILFKTALIVKKTEGDQTEKGPDHLGHR